MKTPSKLFLIILLILCKVSYSQLKYDKTVSNYFIQFFQSQETIDFLQSKRDSVITVYDVDSILTECGTTIWGNKKLNVITVGENINKIRKDGIFTSIRDSTDFIIVSKNTIDDVTFFRAFKPHTGADGHYGIKKIKGQYTKLETSYGWF